MKYTEVGGNKRGTTMSGSVAPPPGWWRASDGQFYAPEQLPVGWTIDQFGNAVRAPEPPPPPASTPTPTATDYTPAPAYTPAPGQAGYFTILPPASAMAQMVMLIAQHGGTITSQSNGNITGVVHTKGETSLIVSLILFLLCVVPFILYLMSSNKDTVESFTVTLMPEGPGTRIYGTGQGKALWCAQQAALAMPR